MKSKITPYPVLREVIYQSLAAVDELLKETRKEYILLAYTRQSQDGGDENVLHMQMHFRDTQERDEIWNRATEKIVEIINQGMKRTNNRRERMEIQNILCAVRSEK